MKKTVLFSLLLSTTTVSLAQNVGINSTGAAAVSSAALDVDMANKGILVPRVALTTTAAFAPVTGTATTSLLVFNTATAGNVTPGFYYWGGSAWIRFASSGSAWDLLGNAGTAAATNFVGTTDAVDFVIRTSNTERARVASGGAVGIGTTTPGTSYYGTAVYGLNVIKSTTAAGTAMSEFENTSTLGVCLGADNSTTNNGYNAFEGTINYTVAAGGPSGVAGIALGTTGWGNGVVAATNSTAGFGLYAQAPFANTAGVYAIYASGRVITTGNYYTTSDARLKTNIRKSGGSLNKILQLNPVQYDFKPEYSQFVQGTNEFGFLAQELEQVIPGVVSSATLRSHIDFEKNGAAEVETFDAKVVSYTALVPYLVEAMQEQQKLIEELQKRLAELEAQQKR